MTVSSGVTSWTCFPLPYCISNSEYQFICLLLRNPRFLRLIWHIPVPKDMSCKGSVPVPVKEPGVRSHTIASPIKQSSIPHRLMSRKREKYLSNRAAAPITRKIDTITIASRPLVSVKTPSVDIGADEGGSMPTALAPFVKQRAGWSSPLALPS
jgi:hypothetical protein